MSKACTNCGQVKDDEEFSWRWKALGKRQSICKDCQREKSAEWYQEHREEHIERSRLQKAETRQTAREFVFDYLSYHVCEKCGEYRPEMLQFDHVRGTKVKTISELANEGASIDTIKKEILKCRVLCANCHQMSERRKRGS